MRILEGVRVLDLTRLLIGDYCTMLLGDMGAEVIKVEEPALGDYIRWAPPFINEQSVLHLLLNRNKRSLKLNLKSEKGKEVFNKLVKRSDLIVENFRPSVAEKLGIDYDSVKKINEQIIYCSISSYGQDGPYKDSPGHDINYLGYAGILDITGPRKSPPVIPGAQIADLPTSLMATLGIIAALYVKEKTGKGQYIDVSALDVATSLIVVPAATFIGEGKPPERGTWFLNGGLPCYNIYETKDKKYITVGCIEEKFWISLCKILDVEDFIPFQYTRDEEKIIEMFEVIRRIFSKKTREEWLKLFVEESLPCGPVQDFEDVFGDPQILHRRMIMEAEYPEVGKVRQFNIPIKFSESSCEIRQPPPAFGAHTESILIQLGYTETEIAEMKQNGII
ncbi:MAG: CaiB/BaiF CoA transferase family protein [Candidatus Hodarchaeota archaeon]